VELVTRRKFGAAIWSLGLLTVLGWLLLVHEESDGVGFGFPPQKPEVALEGSQGTPGTLAVVRER
jgi:hypothetical protein